MVALFDHCTFNLNPRATSIDTPLHAFVPHRHVDHVHADAVIAIAASANARGADGENLWRRDWFSALAAPGLRPRPQARQDGDASIPNMSASCSAATGSSPGGRRQRSCYETTLRIIQKAADWLAANEKEPAFFGARFQALSPQARRDVAARLLPAIRGKISSHERKVGHFSDAPEVLEFVNSHALADLAPLGTSCPDHFLRTKIRPLVLPLRSRTPTTSMRCSPDLDAQLDAYRADYAAYYQRCKHPNSPAMRDPNAVIYLVPGRRHAVVRQGQGDGARRERILRQRDQRHARRLGRQQAMSGSPSRRLSTSSTGCSRRRSSRACPNPNRLPDASR